MLNYKSCRAIVIDIWSVNALMDAVFDVDGEVRRQNGRFAFDIRLKNSAETEKFKARLIELGIQVKGRVFFCDNMTIIPEDVAKELLAKCLEVDKIWCLAVNGNDQIILIDG